MATCNFLHFVFIVGGIVLSVPWSSCEQKFDGYKINNGVAVDATSLRDCARACLQKLTCTAISFCNPSSSPSCQHSLCGNIQLASNSSCTTLYFLEVAYIEGVNLPAVTHEWMPTDACGYASNTFANSGPLNGPTLTYSGNLGDTTTTPSTGYMFGNSFNVGNYKFSTNRFAVISENVVSMFMFFKLLDNTTTSTLKLQWSLQYSAIKTAAQSLLILISSKTIQINADFISCGSCQPQTVNVNLIIGQWYTLTAVLDDSRTTFTLILNSSTILTSTTTTIFPALLSIDISTGGTGQNATFSCLKLFNSSINANNITNIVKSCQVGKIGILRLASRSCIGGNFTIGTKNYLIPSTATLFYAAFTYCKSIGYNLLKVESTTEFSSISSNLVQLYGSSATVNFWTSMYRNVSTEFTWLADYTSIQLTQSTRDAYKITTNDPEPACSRIKLSNGAVTIDDRQCTATDGIYSPICTC